MEIEELKTIWGISIVIPVYQGETTLRPLIEEIEPFTKVQENERNELFQINEVILVCDGAIDNSQEIIQQLAAEYSFVALIWLSRNYGQHPATLAGMASTVSDWVVTMDEDGQHNPQDIGKLLSKALQTDSQLVYAKPANEQPHGWFRNKFSHLTKWIFANFLEHEGISYFNSFRLIRGDIARSLAAYCGIGIYLDVALSWIVHKSVTCPVVVRVGSDRSSGYDYKKLIQHFFRLFVMSSTKPLRFISLLGLSSMGFSLFISAYVLWEKLTSQIPIKGWTFMVILICFFSGIILLSLGVVTEYLGIVLQMSMGKPLYLTVSYPLKIAKQNKKETLKPIYENRS